MSSSEVLNISDSDGGDGSRETKGSGDFLKGKEFVLLADYYNF